jgi:hypothetical protein
MARRGFAPIVILLIAAGIMAIGGIWYYATHKSATAVQAPSLTQSSSSTLQTSSITALESASSSAPGAISKPILVMLDDLEASKQKGDIIGYATTTRYLFVGHQGSMANGGEIDIYDLFQSSTQPIAEYAENAYIFQAFALGGNYIFLIPLSTAPLGNSNPTPSLQIIDVSDPLKPTLVASSTFGDESAQGISFNGGYIVLTGKIFINNVPVNISRTIDFSDIGNLKVVEESTSSLNSPTPELFTLSSSTQVGKFTVVADCDASGGETILKQIEIFDGNTLKQTISGQVMQLTGSDDGVCSQPEARDINSDGYPDFSVVSNIGNEYIDSVYWLYASSTDQFSCPNPKPSGKPWMACYLIEPL